MSPPWPSWCLRVKASRQHRGDEPTNRAAANGRTEPGHDDRIAARRPRLPTSSATRSRSVAWTPSNGLANSRFPTRPASLSGSAKIEPTGSKPEQLLPPTSATGTWRSSSRISCPSRERRYRRGPVSARRVPRRCCAGTVILPQAPPNLSDEFGDLLDAGVSDWGGVSPVTMTMSTRATVAGARSPTGGHRGGRSHPCATSDGASSLRR